MSDLHIKIKHFEQSSIITNGALIQFISMTFPNEHLKFITEIKYVDVYKSLVGDQSLDCLLVTGLNITSQWSKDEETDQEIIEVFRQDFYGCKDSLRIKKDVAHEIGHSVYEHLTKTDKDVYQDLWISSDYKKGFNKKMANNLEEDFCCTYAMFFLEREMLFIANKPKHDFMYNICSGK